MRPGTNSRRVKRRSTSKSRSRVRRAAGESRFERGDVAPMREIEHEVVTTVGAELDAVADALIAQAEHHLVDDFRTLFDTSVSGPVVLGGGVMPHLAGVSRGISEIINAAGQTPEIRLAADGSVGAVVLAMRAIGAPVDAATLTTIAASIKETATTRA